MLNKVNVCIGIIVGLIAISGTLIAIDKRWAKADDLKTVKTETVKDLGEIQKSLQIVNTRLEGKILYDQSCGIQQRIWKLEDRYEHKKTPRAIKDEIRMLKLEKNKIDEELKNLKK